MAYELMLLDTRVIRQIYGFYDIFFEFMKSWGGYDAATAKISSEPVKEIMKQLPETILEDMIELYNFTFTNNRQQILTFQREDLINIIEQAIVVLRSKEAITNPYHGAHLVERMSQLVYHEVKTNNGSLGLEQLYLGNKTIVNYLMESIMEFYVDIETTGSSNQYYEKFSYRHCATTIFERFWKMDIFKQKTRELSGRYLDKFLNALLNDNSHCLEEGLECLKKIKAFEVKLQNGFLPNDEEKKNHGEDERSCTANVQLSKKGLFLIKELTSWASDFFDNDLFKERVASSLSLVLQQLMDSTIQVKNPKKYKFDKLSLLKDVAKILGNMAKLDNFVRLMTQCHNYKIEIFKKSLNVLRKHREYEIIPLWESLLTKLKDAEKVELTQSQEVDPFDDPPEVFLDPIGYCMMEDPVQLPTSGNIMERSVIERILLNDEHDPFNRAPLKPSDLVTDEDMVERIAKWKEQILAGVETDEAIRERQEREEEEKEMEERKSAKQAQQQKKEEEKKEESKPAPSAPVVENDSPMPDSNPAGGDDMTEEEMMQLAMQMSMESFNNQK